MARYQTFFLCGSEWKDAVAFVEFVKWITPLLEPHISIDTIFGTETKCALTVVKRSDSGKRRPSFSGDYFKYVKRLEENGLESLSVFAGAGPQMHLRVEFSRMKSIGPSRSEPTTVEVSDGIKIVSVSLESSLWRLCQESGIAGELSDRWTRLFASSGALYGFSTPTKLPRTSNTNLIGPERSSVEAYDPKQDFALRPGDQVRYPRIRDFDYSKFVEAVYQVNYVSSVQLEHAGIRDRILDASRDVIARVVTDLKGKPVGVAVELKNDSRATKIRCAELLGNLLWKPAQS